MATICVRFIDAPDAFSQTYDAVYHLNAVRWIIDTGNASSVDFDMVVSNGTVYPLGWHTLVVLTMRLSGVTSIPLATNAVMCAVAVLVWTSGIMMLTGALTADRRAGRSQPRSWPPRRRRSRCSGCSGASCTPRSWRPRCSRASS